MYGSVDVRGQVIKCFPNGVSVDTTRTHPELAHRQEA